MNKKLTLVAASALMLATSFSMAGCADDKIKKVAPEFKGEFSTKAVDLPALTSMQNYAFGESDDTGLVVVSLLPAGFGGTTTYQLFDLVTQQFLNFASSSEVIQCLDDGLFYSVNNTGTTPMYTLYSRSGMLNPKAGTVDTYNGVFTSTEATPIRTYVDVNGKIQEESDPFKELFTMKNSKQCGKIGKYYLNTSGSSFNFTIYNNKGAKVRNFNATLRLGMSTNAEVNSAWYIGTKLFMQVVTALPESVDAYDYYKNGTKYDIVTYSYDVKDDKVSKVKDFNYFVGGMEMLNDDNVILSVKQIKNKQIIEQSFIQSFDKKGKVAIDLQKLVPGAIEYEYDPISKCSYLTDISGYKHIFDGNKRVRTLDDGLTVVGDRILRTTTAADATHGSLTTLIIYDAKNSNQNMTVSNIIEYEITDSNDICYRDSNNQIYLLDTEKMTSTFKASFNAATDYYMDIEDNYITIYRDQAQTIYFLDTAETILLNGDIDTFNYEVDHKNYEIIKCEQTNGASSSYTYKMIISTTPYSTLFD